MAADTGPVLSARQVSVRFGGLHALEDVDLEVGAGRVTGLIGPNGAGKTTLFNVLSGLIRPVAGTVHLGGEDVTGWPPHRRGRGGVGRSFQRLELFARLRVEENLVAAWESAHPGAIFGRGRTERRRRVAEVVDLLGLGPIARRTAGELPTGLGRMVELGRALCTDPKVLLLDEPSSGLDHGETNQFAAVLRRLVAETGPAGRQLAVLLVEHDMALVMEVCSAITVLDFGRRIACGTPAEIRGDAGVRAAYLGESDVA
ncbi:MAG: ATP-binding cassette domain-containing protein [Acidobacteriota bacterium]|nr:ATP-binding cassette domain-containing protein [Acidobacteriota bacterium]